MHVVGTVADILKSKPEPGLWSISPDATVFDALRLMADKNIGAVLVMSEGKLVGVFSERDYARKVILKGKSSRELTVNDIMSKELITSVPAQSVDDCLQIVTQNRVRHLPILDGPKVVGVVSIGDLVNWVLSTQSVRIDQLESYLSGQYPA